MAYPTLAGIGRCDAPYQGEIFNLEVLGREFGG